MALSHLRLELAFPRTSLQLCLLGILGGACAASLIILFRLCVEWLQLIYLGEVDHFTTLEASGRFLLPIGGAVLVVVFAYLTGFKHYRMGIPFVIHRVKQFYGHIPIRTTLNQFFGGMIALASGFVVGREGPSVHLGAAGSGFIGHWLKLPYNSIRILAGCGIAAGISASFNTPFAAVIFVMEVVLREYKIHIFIPVMLAAACGSVLTRIVFGQEHELSFLQFHAFSQWIFGYLILLGVVLGVIAWLFNNNLMFVIKKFRPLRMRWRLLLAGIITGSVGFVLPESMGAGLEPTLALFADDANLYLLLAILVAKFSLAIVAIGLGIPGGVIGPVFVIGMLSGAILSLPLAGIMDVDVYSSSFALLGMAGLLTAVLHAPLAALSAVMELSYSPEVILPAMLVIVPAYITSTQFLGNSSIFIRQLDYQKLPYTLSSVKETLQKVGVLAAMDTEYKLFNDAPNKQILDFLDTAPTHPVVQSSDFEIDVEYALVEYNISLDHEAEPLTFYNMSGVPAQATLAEVWDILQAGRRGAVYVYDDEPAKILGVITWNSLRSYLHKEQY